MKRKNKYIIIPSSKLSNEHINHSTSNHDSLRKTADGRQVILKFAGNIPNIFVKERLYTHQEILKELKSPQWNGVILKSHDYGIMRIASAFIVAFMRYLMGF